jgi:hypothetical protein
MDVSTIALPLVALITSGFAWTMSGYISNWRSNHTDPKWKGFNMASLRDDLILGGILGVGAVVMATYDGSNLASITNLQQFITAVAAGFGVVAIVDKVIVGGILNR